MRRSSLADQGRSMLPASELSPPRSRDAINIGRGP